MDLHLDFVSGSSLGRLWVRSLPRLGEHRSRQFPAEDVEASIFSRSKAGLQCVRRYFVFVMVHETTCGFSLNE